MTVPTSEVTPLRHLHRLFLGLCRPTKTTATPTDQPSDHTPLGRPLLCDLYYHNYSTNYCPFAMASPRSGPLTSMYSICTADKHLFYRTISSAICVSNGWTLQILLPWPLERAFSRVLGFSPNLPRFITIQSIISLKKASHDGLNSFIETTWILNASRTLVQLVL